MNCKFLGEEGITSTSANHLCNLAKEQVRAFQIELQNISFCDTFVIFNKERIQLRQGSVDLGHIQEILQKIGQLHSFIAYMREAMKEKEALKYDIPAFGEYLKDYELPKVTVVNSVTFEDVFSELSIKDQQKYLELEAYCAVLGKNIHPEGSVHKARQEMYQRLSEPATIDGDKIYIYETSAQPSNVDELFFALQKEHRGYEAHLNAMKHSLENEILKRNNANLELHAKELEIYNHRVEELKAQYELYVADLKSQHAKLKIIIPNSLKKTYDYLSNL